jgi:ADP-ribose pyrophosphatase YjhB (NUDIX family)
VRDGLAQELMVTTTLQKAPRPSVRARVVSRIITFAALFQRPMTLGVRGLVIDPDDRVLLVRHTYVPGFYLPGGGVESGETMLQALTRELHEEGNVRILGAPTLQGVYLNRRASPRDHVALYVVRDFHCDELPKPNHEIAEARFFPVDALPPDITPATRARLMECLDGAPISPYW